MLLRRLLEAVRILRRPTPLGRGRLLRHYLHFIWLDLTGSKTRQVRLFGQTIAFDRFFDFFCVFEEIFVRGYYRADLRRRCRSSNAVSSTR